MTVTSIWLSHVYDKIESLIPVTQLEAECFFLLISFSYIQELIRNINVSIKLFQIINWHETTENQCWGFDCYIEMKNSNKRTVLFLFWCFGIIFIRIVCYDLIHLIISFLTYLDKCNKLSSSYGLRYPPGTYNMYYVSVSTKTAEQWFVNIKLKWT